MIQNLLEYLAISFSFSVWRSEGKVGPRKSGGGLMSCVPNWVWSLLLLEKLAPVISKNLGICLHVIGLLLGICGIRLSMVIKPG